MLRGPKGSDKHAEPCLSEALLGETLKARLAGCMAHEAMTQSPPRGMLLCPDFPNLHLLDCDLTGVGLSSQDGPEGRGRTPMGSDGSWGLGFSLEFRGVAGAPRAIA